MPTFATCPTCGKRYDAKRHTVACPHRYQSLQKRLDAGEIIPGVKAADANPAWKVRHAAIPR